MAASHLQRLYVDGSSFLHRWPAQCKLLAMVLFVFAVVATRREAVWALVVDAAVLLTMALAARLPVLVLAKRLVVGAPFLVFALLLPFVARGPRTDIGPLSLSSDGLWGTWNILAKGTLGLGASILLVATTTVPDLIRGLGRLRVPAVITSILTFMVRYSDVTMDELHRMRIARLSRAHDPRWLWQVRAVTQTAGALFIRSYERGERVHLAMRARGYTGHIPRLASGDGRATRRQWVGSSLVVIAAAAAATASWVVPV